MIRGESCDRRWLLGEVDIPQVDGEVADAQPVVAAQLGRAGRLPAAVADPAVQRPVGQRGDTEGGGQHQPDRDQSLGAAPPDRQEEGGAGGHQGGAQEPAERDVEEPGHVHDRDQPADDGQPAQQEAGQRRLAAGGASRRRRRLVGIGGGRVRGERLVGVTLGRRFGHGRPHRGRRRPDMGRSAPGQQHPSGPDEQEREQDVELFFDR